MGAIRPRAAQFAALALATAAVAAGCGGSDEEEPPRPILGNTGSTPTLTSTEPEPSENEDAVKGTKVSDVPAVPPARTYAVRPLATVERRVERRLREYREALRRRQAFTAAEQLKAQLGGARDLTEAVMIAAGLEFATFDIAKGGRLVTINVDRKSACTLRASDPEAFERRIVDDSDVVEQVRVRVEGSDLSLERYLERNCRRRTPATPGRVVLRANGKGITETQAFRVRGRRWAIAFESGSALLQVYLLRDGKLRSLVINRRGRGTGTKAMRGRGRYRLRVAGTGDWSLRVLDQQPRPRRRSSDDE